MQIVLRARKHLNPDTCTLRVMSLILAEILRRRTVKIDSLRSLVERRGGEDAVLAFLPALQVLFLLGKVEFHPKTDTIEFLS